MPTSVNALAVMAKAPVPGAVKTRLVPPLTPVQAAALYQALLLDQLDQLRLMKNVDLYLAFTPDDAEATMKEMTANRFLYFPQQGEELGERMSQVFVELLGRGYRQVILIGSDLPALPPDFFHRAFMQLAATTNHVVLGPSQDGGYYLVGMNRLTPQIFRSMTWSHDQVLRQTTAKLAALGVDFSYLPAWFDVDTVKDIERVRSLGDPAIRNAMKRTLSCLEALEL